jgi:hypothetical protein
MNERKKMTLNPMQEFFRQFHLPLNRRDDDVYTFLDNHFQKFNSELSILLTKQNEDQIFDAKIYAVLEQKQEILHNFSEAILNTLKAYRNGEISTAYNIFEGKMDEIQNHLAFLNLKGFNLFRIRQDIKKITYLRKELFHIPFDNVTLIQSRRYSIPGFPCLYLGGSAYSDTGLSLCWFECNLPDKFYWSEFEIQNTFPLFLVIDFVYSPFSSATKAINYSIQAHNKSSTMNSDLINYIITYPLMAACSLITVDKNDNGFVPEYVLPQMLLLWARNNIKCNGVAYLSSSGFNVARDHLAFNIAVPAKQVETNGYCKTLSQQFKLSEPVFVDITNDIFTPLNKKKLVEIRSFIYEKSQTLDLEPLQKMVSICDSFSFLYAKMLSGKNQDISFIYDYINNLNLFIETLRNFEEYYYSESLKKIKKIYEEDEKNKKDAIASYNSAWKKFIEFREILRNYWNFIDKAEQLNMLEKPEFKFIDEINTAH